MNYRRVYRISASTCETINLFVAGIPKNHAYSKERTTNKVVNVMLDVGPILFFGHIQDLQVFLASLQLSYFVVGKSPTTERFMTQHVKAERYFKSSALLVTPIA